MRGVVWRRSSFQMTGIQERFFLILLLSLAFASVSEAEDLASDTAAKLRTKTAQERLGPSRLNKDSTLYSGDSASFPRPGRPKPDAWNARISPSLSRDLGEVVVEYEQFVDPRSRESAMVERLHDIEDEIRRTPLNTEAQRKLIQERDVLKLERSRLYREYPDYRGQRIKVPDTRVYNDPNMTREKLIKKLSDLEKDYTVRVKSVKLKRGLNINGRIPAPAAPPLIQGAKAGTIPVKGNKGKVSARGGKQGLFALITAAAAFGSSYVQSQALDEIQSVPTEFESSKSEGTSQ